MPYKTPSEQQIAHLRRRARELRETAQLRGKTWKGYGAAIFLAESNEADAAALETSHKK